MSHFQVLVNPWNPCTFVPKLRLVNIYFHDTPADSPKRCMEPTAAYALESLIGAAQKQSLKIAGISGFRSVKRQQEIFFQSLQTNGTKHTRSYIALPGYSEHHTGLAMDVSSKQCHYELEVCFEQTKEFAWLQEHSACFGFILRYPKNKENITGYHYEPWHYRYVGIPLAKLLTSRQLTLEEYLQNCIDN